MKVRIAAFAVGLSAVCLVAFGQVGNGILTGTVTDPAGAAIAAAKVDAKNVETGVVYSSLSTNAGNYAIPDLPAGTYTVTASVTGFKTYSHTNVQVAAASTLKEDIPLQVGDKAESVTVRTESSLLQTETGDLASNITIGQLDALPILGVGPTNAGPAGFRNPFNVVTTIPGETGYNPPLGISLVINGLSQQANLVEGQESTARVLGQSGSAQYYEIGQMGVDAIQEMAFQTRNYAPEFGTASSAVINTTMKSGANQWHGSGYEYFVNEDLYAGAAFSRSGGCITGYTSSVACSTIGGSGGKYDPRNRRNDFGGTLGGPIYIPKVYDGHNKSFFFFSYEQYLETNLLAFPVTAAVPAYTQGNFGAISPNGNCSLCSTYGIQQTALGTPTVQKDALGNLMFANDIYDPTTRGTTATGLGYASSFANNMIPANRFSPITVKLTSLIASLGVVPSNANLINNYTGTIPGRRYSVIPSIKIDHNIDAKDKLSFFYSENNTQGQVSTPSGNADGLPFEIGAYRGAFISTWTYRLNYDRTITPTLLLHMGAGYIYTTDGDHAPFLNFDPSQFGLTGFLHDRQFPSVTGMSSATYGGMQNIGTFGQSQSTALEEKPTYNVNLTWVKGRHTFKFGGSLVEEATNPTAYSGVTLNASAGAGSGCAAPAACEPFTPSSGFNGFTTGFGYASWLLGDYGSTTQTPQTDPRYHDMDWAFFAQDSWKITRKLTVDYGLRWDYFGVETEQYNRLAQFSETVPNPLAGGHPGSTIFANTCNCSFYQPGYPFAIAPRVGVAYQIDPKTVFRAGWGLTYQLVENLAGGLVSTNGTYPLVGINQFVNDQTPGFIPQPTWPVTTNLWPVAGSMPGTAGQVPVMPDANQNRPPRINQWSAGFQREITRNFMLEAEYVANRAAWLSGFLAGGTLNHVSPAEYAAYGLYPYPGTGPCATGAGTVCEGTAYNFAPAGVNCQAGNDCARAILGQPLSSSAVIQTLASAGIANYLPYNGFATSNALSTVLGRPFPQYGAIGPGYSPTGDSKYDSLQVKATKRFSHGLQAGGFFTWAQGFTRAIRQDYFNPASNANTLTQIPPRTLNFNVTYITPRAEFIRSRIVNQIIKDWQASFFGNYQSGAFLQIPGTPNAEFLPTQDIYTGKPLYAPGVNLNNLGSYNPETTQVLNPAAWQTCPVNTNCGDSGNDFLKNFRGPRHPMESANLGRNFRIKERMNLQVRAEFVNVFNRTYMPSPSTANPQNPVAKNSLGILTSGFGVVNVYQAPNSATIFTGNTGPRSGTIIARFSF